MSNKKVWFVTGASRGMSVEFVKAALAAGHAVVASGRDPDRVSKTLGQSNNLLAVRLDVTSRADAEAAVVAAVDRFGRIDVLVNNAASFYAGYFEELTPEQLDRQLAASLIGPMNVTRAVLPVMRKQRSGHIISISSSAGLAAGFEFVTAYAASKFGLEGWMESLQAEVAPFGITTTIVNPGLVALPVGPDHALMPSLLTLSDVLGTGHHAALAAKASPGKIVAVVGDGAVGLCGVIAARRLGAEQIIMLGRHADRIALARKFGATDVVSDRGDAAIERVRELTGGLGAHSVLECVGHGEAMRTTVSIARAGGAVGRVGVPQETTLPNAQPTFYDNMTIAGGPAPVRAYMHELLPDVLEGRIEPGLVFDRVTNIDGVPDGYRAMNEREAIKVMIEF